jgi:hypothetical protein
MNQARTPSVPSLQQRNLTARWLALAGVVGPMVYVAVFTFAGFLRPGYSPIHQAISDLGVGPNGWLLDESLAITGLLLIVFTVSFAWYMRPVLSRGWRLIVWVGSHQRAGTQSAYQGEPEQSRGKHDAAFRKRGGSTRVFLDGDQSVFQFELGV